MLYVFLNVLAITSVALYLIPTGAHLFELPAKMAMAPTDYMVVQQVYAGWALFGAVVFAALLHAIVHRRAAAAFRLSLTALVCLIATQVIFWVFTYPANVASDNWTTMPHHFEYARQQWEYSHAASAILTFASLVTLTASAVQSQPGTTTG